MVNIDMTWKHATIRNDKINRNKQLGLTNVLHWNEQVTNICFYSVSKKLYVINVKNKEKRLFYKIHECHR